MTVAAPAMSRTLAQVERNFRDRAEVVDVIVHAPLWSPSRRTYRRWLCDLYGFIAPLEAKLSYSGLELSFITPRMKASRLASDLLDIGMTRTDHALLMRPCAIPELVDPVQAIAWLAVVERMTWKLESIRCMLMKVPSLATAMETAGSFLRTHEGVVRERWFELGHLVDQHVKCGEALERMTACAYDCLDCLDQWMVK
jgi:heme oxygenase